MATTQEPETREYVVLEDVTTTLEGDSKVWREVGTFSSTTARGAIKQAADKIDETGEKGPVVFRAFPARNDTQIGVGVQMQRVVTLGDIGVSGKGGESA